jgi:hypothetical protein
MVRRLGQRPRPRRAVRAVSVAAALLGIAGLAAAGTPRGTGSAGAEQAAPAAREPLSGTTAASPTGTPTADPLAAPSTREPAADPLDESGAPSTLEPAGDPLTEAAARARRITDATDEWASFTLVDRNAGRFVGDRRSAQQTNSESVVKAWLVADLLATATAQRRQLSDWEQRRMAAMIRISDDDAAEVIWRSLGGDASIKRMIKVCRLTDTEPYPGRWSLTQISSRDMARLGACLAPGPGKLLTRSTSAELIRLMRSVEGSGAFGIQSAEPAGKGVRLAIKNGWTEHGGTGLWNVNCLAMWGPDLRWVLAVALRYPIPLGLSYGADVCRRVTTALFPDPPGLSPGTGIVSPNG